MSDKNNKSMSLVDLASDLRITSWNKLSGDQIAKILEYAGKAKIGEIEVQRIAGLSSMFVPAATNYLTMIQKTIDAAQQDHQKFLEHQKDVAISSLGVLRKIADEVGIEQKMEAARLIKELAEKHMETIERANRQHGGFIKAVLAIGAGALLLGGLALKMAT